MPSHVRAGLIGLIALNAVVLLGQIWPEGAPPFARAVNIAFLVANLAVLVFTARSHGSTNAT
jgi:hypothetical protein